MIKPIQTDFVGEGMSLFIPFVHANVSEEKIRKVFANLGTIRLVKFLDDISKTTGKPYKMVYIYLEKWNETKKTRKFQTNVQENGGLKVKYNGGVGYWTVLPNKHWTQKTYRVKEPVVVDYNDTYESIFNSELREIFGCVACEGILV